MLPVRDDHLRLFVHVLAAAVWVGGQFTLAGLVPVLRGFGPDATRAAARRFNLVAWSAFAVLLASGVWNLFAVDVGDASDEYLTTLLLKLVAVAVTGAGAAMSSLGAVAALFLGVVLGD